MPKIIKIYRYNTELYRFKVGAFLRHSVESRDVIDDVANQRAVRHCHFPIGSLLDKNP